MKIIILLKWLKDLYRHKGMLMQKFADFKNDERYKKKFVQKFGYFPTGLEYSNFECLDLAENSRIGNYNKLILSETKFPSSNKKSLISLAPNTWTGTGVELNVISGSQIIIKQYSTIQDYCKIIGDVVIERYCVFAPMVYISSGNHYAEKGNPDLIRNQDFLHLTSKQLVEKHSKKVHIEEDCWIGIGTFIRQGVYIGRGAVIGANACITTDILPYSIVVGNNKIINNRIIFNPLMQIEASNKDHLPYFYRGFMQKDDERVDENLFALYEEEAIVVLQKKDCSKWIIEGNIRGNLNNMLIAVTINNTLEFEYNISKPNFEMIFDISNAKKVSQSTSFLAERYNVIELKTVGYKFSKNNFIAIDRITQSL